VAEGGLVRVALGPGGTPAVGRTLPGRGAWLCANLACLELALRRRTLGRALRCDIGTDAAAALRSRFPAPEPGARDYEAAPSRRSGHPQD